MSAPHAKLILGIETSCDETAAAVVDTGGMMRSSVVASQHELHAEYKGVVPEIASRAHAERLLPVVRAAVEEAGVCMGDLWAVAVGHKPGLIGSLLVGVAGAKALAWALGVPLVGVDHVHAHLFAGFLRGEDGDAGDASGTASDHALIANHLPAIGLVLSGGHTSIFAVHGPGEVERVGATIDDAVGEAFDKVASILGLATPTGGGPAVERLAGQCGSGRAGPGQGAKRFNLPISTLGPHSLDFSFSGLKTAVLYAACGVPERGESPVPGRVLLDEAGRAELCAAFQRAVVDAVELKLRRAFAIGPEARSLLVGGGVTANRAVREMLARVAKEHGVPLVMPPMNLCVDNAAMIAWMGALVLESRAWASDPLSLAATPTT